MTAQRLAGTTAVVGAFVIAVLLALFAADVVRSQRALERADARFGAVAGTTRMWDADTVLPAEISRKALGIRDDLEIRDAFQRFRLTRPREPITRFSQLTARSGAERVLARVSRDDRDRSRRSAVFNLRGALALEEARLGTSSAPALRRAAGHFRRAVELDSANDDARFNLELSLRLLSRSSGSSGGGGSRASTPASGAGAATSGSGY
jgi:hypothetical protein